MTTGEERLSNSTSLWDFNAELPTALTLRFHKNEIIYIKKRFHSLSLVHSHVTGTSHSKLVPATTIFSLQLLAGGWTPCRYMRLSDFIARPALFSVRFPSKAARAWSSLPETVMVVDTLTDHTVSSPVPRQCTAVYSDGPSLPTTWWWPCQDLFSSSCQSVIGKLSGVVLV